MGGTNQPATRGIEEPVGVEVHFHGHMRAAVQVRVDHAFKPDGKRPACLALEYHLKGHGHTAIRQFGGLAQGDGIGIVAHRAASGVVPQPLAQLAGGVGHKKRPQRGQGALVVGAVAHTHRRTTGVDRHLQVVCGVANH